MSADDQKSGDRTEPPGQAPSFQVRIPVEWEDADADLPIIYANQVMVSHMGPEFFLTFGVVLPPTTMSGLPDSLIIQPQVRMAIAREAMPSVVKALSDGLQRYREARAAAGTGPGAPGAPGGGGAAGAGGSETGKKGKGGNTAAGR